MTKRNSFVATNAFSGLKISHTCRAFAAGFAAPDPNGGAQTQAHSVPPDPLAGSGVGRGRRGKGQGEREKNRSIPVLLFPYFEHWSLRCYNVTNL